MLLMVNLYRILAGSSACTVSRSMTHLPLQGSGTTQDFQGKYYDQVIPFDQLQASIQLLDFPRPFCVKAWTFAQNLDTSSGRFKVTSV